MVIVRSKTILPAIFYEVNVMQYESISSMTVVSGYISYAVERASQFLSHSGHKNQNVHQIKAQLRS